MVSAMILMHAHTAESCMALSKVTGLADCSEYPDGMPY
jgi:hypothetical protein